MAGDWIKFEHATPDKPEIVRMAAILNIDQDAVLGKCLRLWVWADQQSIDGRASGVTETFLDRLVYCPGFSAALREVDWLQARSGSLVIPHFDRHNGQSAKKRALASDRKVASRKRHASSVTKTCPEKRREEKSKDTPKPPQAGADRFDEFWEKVPHKIGKGNARRAYDKAMKGGVSHDAIVAGLPGYRDYEAQRKAKDPSGYQPLHPATWLNGERWSDEHAKVKPDGPKLKVGRAVQ